MRMPLFFILALVAIAGCTSGSDEPADVTQPVVARSPGKPLHPIQVRAVVDGQLRAGEESEAKLIVTTSRPAESIEVVLQPELATVLSENRFERRDGELLRYAPMDFKFRVRPASSAPQPIKVLVRLTGKDGRVLTREVTLPLGAGKKTRRPGGKSRVEVVDDVPEPEGDAIVPARQEITRDE